MSTRSSKRRPPSDPLPETSEPQDPEAVQEPGNGAAAQEQTSETMTAIEEEPAQVQLTIKGSDRSARAAAKRFGGEATKPSPVATPAHDPEPPDDDPIIVLLSDGKNMVLVTRQTPRSIRSPRGEKIVTNVRLPGKYTCPTSIGAIEDQVFTEHGGTRYKCTIHPDTSAGENQILGHFTIEHPDSNAGPFIEGVTDVDPISEESQIPMGGDPTLHETDALADVREQLKRQLERAQTMKEIAETRKLIKSIEDEMQGKATGSQAAPSAESEEVRKVREENAKLREQLAEKKVNDRFDRLETSIASLAQSVTVVTTAKPHESAESPTMKFIIEKMKSDDVRFSEMMKAITARQVPAGSTEDNFDKMLDRLAKMKTAFGAKDSRVADLEERLIEASIDRMMGGDEGGPTEEEDAFKFALKQMTPVLKSYVERKVGEKEVETGEPASKEEMKKAYEEAGRKAALEIAEKWQREGLVVRTIDPKTGKPVALPPPTRKPTVPPRAPIKPGDRPGTVTSIHQTPQGQVKMVRVEPHDLSKKPARPADQVSASVASEPPMKEEITVKYTTLPGIGENGTDLKVELPAQPGDLQYDRKRSVNFVLDSIRSEILREVPRKSPDDSVVVGDALELLDEEILDQISKVESGTDLEKALGTWGDPVKIAQIKESANKDEEVSSWLRRIVITIQDNWKDYKRQGL